MSQRGHFEPLLLLALFGSVKELRESLCPCVYLSVCLSGCPSVCLSVTKGSKALNLHLSLIGLSQVSLAGQFQVSLCLLRQTDGA